MTLLYNDNIFQSKFKATVICTSHFSFEEKILMPITIILMGVVFNGIIAYLQAHWLYILSPNFYTTQWILSIRFIVGMLIILSGFFINLQSDHIIRNLRPKDSKEDF